MSNNEGRAKLSHDFSVIGEGVPMLSADGAPLEVDTVVYSGDVTHTTSGGRYTDHAKKHIINHSVLAWRVIQVNYKERYVRVRNQDGCEQTVSFHEGCAVLKLYKDFKVLKSRLRARLVEERDITLDQIEKRKALLVAISNIDKLLDKSLTPPRSPPATAKVLPKKNQKLPEEE